MRERLLWRGDTLPADAGKVRLPAGVLRELEAVAASLDRDPLPLPAAQRLDAALGEVEDPDLREAVRRLVAEGAFEMRPNRSVRVPLMTRDKILELRDIRLELEGLATEKAAARTTREHATTLRRIAGELMAVRTRGDTVADRQKIREFAAGTAPIYACGPDGLRRIFTLDELLPVSFGPEHLL